MQPRCIIGLEIRKTHKKNVYEKCDECARRVNQISLMIRIRFHWGQKHWQSYRIRIWNAWKCSKYVFICWEKKCACNVARARTKTEWLRSCGVKQKFIEWNAFSLVSCHSLIQFPSIFNRFTLTDFSINTYINGILFLFIANIISAYKYWTFPYVAITSVLKIITFFLSVCMCVCTFLNCNSFYSIRVDSILFDLQVYLQHTL